MRRLVGALALAVSVSACGSTVQVTGSGAAAVGDGLGGPATTATASSDLGAGMPGLGAGDGANGAVRGSKAARAASPSGASGELRVGVSRPTSTAAPAAITGNAPVRIGVLYADGLDKVAANFGVSGLSTGDTYKQSLAVVDWIKSHGGLGGHPVQVYGVAIDLSRASSDPDGANQEACVKLTQDYKVRFVVTILNLRPVDLPCYAKGGAAVLDDLSAVSSSTMRTYSDFLAAPGEFGVERMLRNLVDDLWSRGWLTASSVVGSLAYEQPTTGELVDALKSALASHGLKLKSDQRLSNDASSINQATSAAVKFRADGVDRVIPVNASPLFVMNAAENQDYHPAYAVNSGFGPGALLETAAPKAQLENSAGIGWLPFLDIGAGTKPGPVSSRETLCFELMRKANQQSTSSTVKGFQANVCNALFYLKDLSDRLPSLPRDVLSQGRPLLGSSVVPASTFRIDVTSRVDGAAGFRSLAYQDECSCFQYVSPVKTAF